MTEYRDALGEIRAAVAGQCAPSVYTHVELFDNRRKLEIAVGDRRFNVELDGPFGMYENGESPDWILEVIRDRIAEMPKTVTEMQQSE